MTTGESTEQIPTEDAITKLRFGADGLIHRIFIGSQEAVAAVRDAAMKAIGRGPDPDFVREDEERVMVPARLLEQMMRRPNPGHGGVNGTSWSTWILGIVGVLIAAGVLGLTSAMFSMTGRLASLETKVDMLVAKDHRP